MAHANIILYHNALSQTVRIARCGCRGRWLFRRIEKKRKRDRKMYRSWSVTTSPWLAWTYVYVFQLGCEGYLPIIVDQVCLLNNYYALGNIYICNVLPIATIEVSFFTLPESSPINSEV